MALWGDAENRTAAAAAAGSVGTENHDKYICFCFSCTVKVKGHAIFCRRHENLKVSFLARSTNPEEKIVDETLGDPLRAEVALDKWEEAKNIYGIKAMVAWLTIKKVFILEWSTTDRQRSVLMDGIEFVMHFEPRLGKVEAKAKWQKVRQDPKAHGYDDFEGEPNTDSLSVWVPVSRERLKDVKKGHSKQFEETTKSEKRKAGDAGVDQERDKLAAVLDQNDMSFSSCFQAPSSGGGQLAAMAMMPGRSPWRVRLSPTGRSAGWLRSRLCQPQPKGGRASP